MRKIVLAINPETEFLSTFKKLKNSNLLKGAEVSLVHIFPVKTHYMDMVPFTFPTEAQQKEISTSINKILNHLKDELFLGSPEHKNAKVECLFDPNPKERMCDYLNENKIELVVSCTKKMKPVERFFHSSFTEYLVKFSPCELLVLRTK